MYQRNNNCPSSISHTHLNTCIDKGRRPLMLKGVEWKEITKHLMPAENTEQSRRLVEEAKYDQYLKNQSQAMTENWNNTIEKMIAKRNADRVHLQRDKLIAGQRLHQEMKEADRRNRQDLLDYAEGMMQHLKAGPQQLENAFKMTEAIEQQRLQREHRAAAFERERINYLTEGANKMKQAQQWIQEQVDQVKNRTARCLEYKQQLAHDIRERQRQHLELNKRQMDDEKVENEAQMNQQNAILSKEESIIQKKKEHVHMNSLESFRLIRQRQLRDAENNHTEDGKICQYLQMKNERETMRKLNEREKKYRRARAVHELGLKVLRSLPDVEGAEERSYQKAIEELASQWDEQEQKRLAHTARMRDARIVHQTAERKELESERQQQIHETERDKWNRLKNDKLNFLHEVQRRSERTKRNRELKKILRDQMEERKLREQMEITDESKYFQEENRKDDEYFMNYADKLINFAANKGRVLQPLIRVVNEYQEKHSLLPPKIELPHLHSQVGIGVAEKEFIVRLRKHGVQK